MRKTPWGFVKWLVGGCRDALRHPQTDRAAKAQIAVWSALLGVVGLNLVMGLWLGMNPFVAGFTIAGICLYAVCLKQALAGMQYRAKLRTARKEREAFQQIVNGL